MGGWRVHGVGGVVGGGGVGCWRVHGVGAYTHPPMNSYNVKIFNFINTNPPTHQIYPVSLCHYTYTLVGSWGGWWWGGCRVHGVGRVATFRFRLNSLCFPCVHGHFPCVFQYINNKYYFYKWPPPPITAILCSF